MSFHLSMGDSQFPLLSLFFLLLFCFFFLLALLYYYCFARLQYSWAAEMSSDTHC